MIHFRDHKPVCDEELGLSWTLCCSSSSFPYYCHLAALLLLPVWL